MGEFARRGAFASPGSDAYVTGTMTRSLPDQFAVQCHDDGRCFAVAVDAWSLAAGRTFERRELRAVDSSAWLAGDVRPIVPKPPVVRASARRRIAIR